jgi:hypothetical protein
VTHFLKILQPEDRECPAAVEALKPLLVITLRALVVRMEFLVLEMWQHRVVGGVASAPRGAPPLRPSLFLFCFSGAHSNSVRCPDFPGVASSFVATDFN